ncbi:hypothetical protein CH063_09235, partial [Colletotrichum higginsianum]
SALVRFENTLQGDSCIKVPGGCTGCYSIHSFPAIFLPSRETCTGIPDATLGRNRIRGVMVPCWTC